MSRLTPRETNEPHRAIPYTDYDPTRYYCDTTALATKIKEINKMPDPPSGPPSGGGNAPPVPEPKPKKDKDKDKDEK